VLISFLLYAEGLGQTMYHYWAWFISSYYGPNIYIAVANT